MVDFGGPYVFILAALLLFVFFVFLMIRRTITGFREGMDRGKQ